MSRHSSVPHCILSYPASSVHANEVVFFVITNVQHELTQSGGHWSPQDMYVGSTIGELGCWVDSAVTRMVQTGTEHSHVPDIAAYIGAGRFASVMDGSIFINTFMVR